MATPTKKRKFNNYAHSKNEINFRTAAKLRFRVDDFVSDKVAVFLKLAAKMKSLSPEMMMAAILPTTAACIGPRGSLKLGDSTIPANLFMIGE